jgi:hypothetical protein
MRIMVRVKMLSFDIFLSDSFTVGIFISTRGICAYIYLSIFLLFDTFPFDIFTIRHFYHSTFLFRHFYFRRYSGESEQHLIIIVQIFIIMHVMVGSKLIQFNHLILNEQYSVISSIKNVM